MKRTQSISSITYKSVIFQFSKHLTLYVDEYQSTGCFVKSDLKNLWGFGNSFGAAYKDFSDQFTFYYNLLLAKEDSQLHPPLLTLKHQLRELVSSTYKIQNENTTYPN